MHTLEKYLLLLDEIGVEIANFTRLYPAGDGFNHYYDLQPTREEMAAFYQELDRLRHKHKVKVFVQGGIPDEFFKDFGIRLKHGNCGALSTELAVQPNGTVTMCPSAMTPLGNILVNTFDEILESDEVKKIFAKKKKLTCSSCSLKGSSCLLLGENDVDMLLGIQRINEKIAPRSPSE